MESNAQHDEGKAEGSEASDKDERAGSEKLIAVYDKRPEHYDGTCLRPLGLCELGGCCDTCWYRPDHPRFKNKKQ